MALQPQKMMSLAWSANSTSMPIREPRVILCPAVPAEAQMVRSSRLAPRRWKNRMRHRLALHQAHGAGVAVGQNLFRILRRHRGEPLGDRRRSPPPS